MQNIRVTLCKSTSWELVVVPIDLVSLSKCFALVSEIDSWLGIAEDLVLLDLGVTATAASYSTALIVLNWVATDKRRGIEEDDSISIVNDLVSDDPAEATFDYKDALSTASLITLRITTVSALAAPPKARFAL